MNKFIRISEFAKQLLLDLKTAQQASQIMQGIMEERSPRISDIAARMPGSRISKLVLICSISVSMLHKFFSVSKSSIQ